MWSWQKLHFSLHLLAAHLIGLPPGRTRKLVKSLPPPRRRNRQHAPAFIGEYNMPEFSRSQQAARERCVNGNARPGNVLPAAVLPSRGPD